MYLRVLSCTLSLLCRELCNEVHDSSMDEVHDSSMDEVHDSSMDEIHDSSMDEVHDSSMDEVHDSSMDANEVGGSRLAEACRIHSSQVPA